MRYWGLVTLLLLVLKPGFIHGQTAGGIVEGRHETVARTVEAVVVPWMQKSSPRG